MKTTARAAMGSLIALLASAVSNPADAGSASPVIAQSGTLHPGKSFSFKIDFDARTSFGFDFLAPGGFQLEARDARGRIFLGNPSVGSWVQVGCWKGTVTFTVTNRTRFQGKFIVKLRQ